jgi:hypothetical protein
MLQQLLLNGIIAGAIPTNFSERRVAKITVGMSIPLRSLRRDQGIVLRHAP